MDNEAVTVFTALINTGGGIMEIPFRIFGELSASALRAIFSVIWNAARQSVYIQNTTRRGACSLEFLMSVKGTELQYCRIPNDKKEAFLKDLEARGGLYTILPDLNTEDAYFEIAFHTTDVPKVNASCEKFKIGEAEDVDIPEGIINLDDYIKNAKKETLDEVQAAYEKELDKEKKADAPDKHIITMNEVLMAGESDTHYYTYVPGTYQKKDGGYTKLLAVPKDESTIIQQGIAIEYILKADESYTLYDAHAYRESGALKASETLSGKELTRYYNLHDKEQKRSLGRAPGKKPVKEAAVKKPVKEAVAKKPVNEAAAKEPVREASRKITKEARMPQAAKQMPVDGRSNRKRPAARFNQFEQRSYDYDSMTLEFVRKLQKESQIKKSFTDNDILDISTKYYLLKPAKSDDLTLVLPKEDVAYDTEKKQYTVTLKDKDYHLLSESQFETGNAEAIASQIPVDKNKAAQYLDTLSERAMEKSKEALDKVKDILPESKGQVL